MSRPTPLRAAARLLGRLGAVLILGLVSAGPAAAQPDAPWNVQPDPLPLEGCAGLDYQDRTGRYAEMVQQGLIIVEPANEFITDVPFDSSVSSWDPNQPSGERVTIVLNAATPGEIQADTSSITFLNLRSDSGWHCYNARQGWQKTRYNHKSDNVSSDGMTPHAIDVQRWIRPHSTMVWEFRNDLSDSTTTSYETYWWQHQEWVGVGAEYDYRLVYIAEFPEVNRYISFENFATIYAQRADRPVASEGGPLDRAEALTLSPNPVRAGRPVRLSGAEPDAAWAVYDTLGRLVARGRSGAIETRGLSPGTYLVRVDGRPAQTFTVR